MRYIHVPETSLARLRQVCVAPTWLFPWALFFFLAALPDLIFLCDVTHRLR
jgi:hypothetical protein